MVTGVYWGPWLGLHRSLDQFSISELIHLANVLAINLGSPMQILLPSSILLMSISAWLFTQKKSKEFYFIIAAIVFVVISLAISVGIELPIVNQMKVWTVSTAPANWEALRVKWVYFTVVRMITGLLGFILFSAAILKPFSFKNHE